MKTEYRIYQTTDFGKRLIDKHYVKNPTIKKARKLAYANRNLISVEWEIDGKKIELRFDPCGDWRKHK